CARYDYDVKNAMDYW
nr:immunoglobulin heavy chain junction region [Mus musculus]